MVSYLRCQATFPHETGVPKDAVVNTFHIRTIDPATKEDAADDFKANLDLFYTGVKHLMSSMYDWNSGTYEFVDLGDDRPRVPFATLPAAWGALATTGLDWPPEVVITVSYRATPVSGGNAKRRRGRFYLGPLQYSASDSPVISTANVDEVANAAANNLSNAASYDWCVYSRYHHYGVPVGGDIVDYDEVPGNLPGAFIGITTVWVDNAWDTQRRRGTSSTYRKTNALL